jgi:hypothetical protein
MTEMMKTKQRTASIVSRNLPDNLLLLTVKMSKLLFCLGFLAVVTSARGQRIVQKNADNRVEDTLKRKFDFSRLDLTALPRPNSGSFTYEQAGKRKNEIYNIQVTPKYFNWTNPATGGAVHINKKDEIGVYQFTLGIYQHRNDTGVFYSAAAKDTFIILKDVKELLCNVGGIGFGNPASVLITSEIPLDKSEAIKRVMEELWTPGVQIYYLTKKR